MHSRMMYALCIEIFGKEYNIGRLNLPLATTLIGF
jgi:hypothetical protein